MLRSSRRSLLLVVLVVMICGCLGALFGQRLGPGATSSDSDLRDGLRNFAQGLRPGGAELRRAGEPGQGHL